MKLRTRGLLVVACALALMAFGVSAAQAKGNGKPAFLPIYKEKLSVPHGVQPWLPTWTPDGSHIVFQDQLKGTTWTIRKNGRRPKCVTCGFSDRPDIIGGFTYAFPDNKRLFISHELGGLSGIDSGPKSDAFILECAPSIYNCATHKYLSIDMSDDKPGVPLIVQRRTWHLAPDGVHLGWMDLRLDGSVMIVGKLVRKADRYVVTDQKAVNPPGPSSLTSTDPTGWANNNQLYELKSFADGGASVIVVGGRHFNVDPLKIRLSDGKITRLTGNKDWDEDGAISPDGALYTLYSWRTRHRLDAFAWIPQIEPFVEMPAFGAVGAFYVSSWPGFQCDLSPWLLGSRGDKGGRLLGQPLNVYPGNHLTPGNNLSGQQFWSPDSTRVLLQERTRTRPPAGSSDHVAQKGLVPNRISIARIARRPHRAQRIVSSRVGSWAPPPTEYFGTTGSGASVTVNGHGGGTADIAYVGDLAKGSWGVDYHHYSADGKTFVDGSYKLTGDRGAYWTIDADIKVTGRHTGSLGSNLILDSRTGPLPKMTGQFTAVYDGKKAPALPKLGPCYKKLPQKSRLQLKVHRKRGNRIVVRVTANVYGDRRPVRNAIVKSGRRKVRTNGSGQAVLKLRGHGRRRVVARAGFTFKRDVATVRLR